ncbi:MAG: hypothetical protein M1828_005859 [Chrysothrix sp. TS-e1954]|nr:MAG: hypothetical protein M1828_005859 [Chrysothrix sp. TS-e1954]
MSIAVATGASSLIQLGLSVGDVATMISLGRSFGNWLSAGPGDDDFLKAVDVDEGAMSLRRGLIDVAAFNKRWRKDCKILVNGRPKVVNDDSLDQFSRFTASMVSIVTALDAFLTSSGVTKVVGDVLKEMLRTTDLGEDLIRAELNNRIRSWRSAGVMRGIALKATQFRDSLLKRQLIQPGYAPLAEAPQFRDLVVWLLLGTDETYTTASSDVAAAASTLTYIAFDLVQVRGLLPHDASRPSSCSVSYDPLLITGSTVTRQRVEAGFASVGQKRLESMNVPLVHSEEAVSVFPLPPEARKACRHAWTQGHDAAAEITVRLVQHDDYELLEDLPDLKYVLRVPEVIPDEEAVTDLSTLAHECAFLVSPKVMTCLQDALGGYRYEAEWLGTALASESDDWYPNTGNEKSIYRYRYRAEAFSVMQSFFLGYYYQLFLRFVDTSSLEMQVVEGNWAYRSPGLLKVMNNHVREANSNSLDSGLEPTLCRQDVLEILAMLLCSRRLDLENRMGFNYCIGVIGRRSLLTASLVRQTDSPETVGRFVLLDIDTGGIPCDSERIIRPGEARADLLSIRDGTPKDFVSGEDFAVPEDITRHIEADWAGNRERVLLTMRYKGRRLFSLNIAQTDSFICQAYVPPLEQTDPVNGLPNAISTGLNDLLEGKFLLNNVAAAGQILPPALFRAYNRPNLRYAAVGLYEDVYDSPEFRLASNSTSEALLASSTQNGEGRYRGARPFISPFVVAGEGDVGRKLRQEAEKAWANP